MSTESKKVWVIGHKNPDTDSICAAISYAYLKNQSGDKKTYVAKRAGAVNEETRYVLERFGVEEPPLVTYAGAQVKDINIRKTAGVSNQISLKRAWELMKKLEVVTLPVTNQFGKLEGVIVTKDIATSYMDVLDNCVLSKARTQYKTIAETIDGEVYAGNEHAHFVRGKVVIATSNPEYMADYIEPTRDFPGVEKLRALAYKDLDAAMALGLEMSLEDIRTHGVQPHRDTADAWQWYTAGH